VELVLQRPVIGLQLFQVGGAALAVPDRVELESERTQPNLVKPFRGELDDLGVERRRRAADGLDVELKELPVATLRWTVISEHRADQIKTRRLGSLVESAFEIGADDARGRLRAQREIAAAAVLETVELFRHRIGVRADSLDQLGVLDDRRHDLFVSESPRHVGGAPFRESPDRPVAREDVADTADGLDGRGTSHWSDDCKNLRLVSGAMVTSHTR
jgi:hypothetical protein